VVLGRRHNILSYQKKTDTQRRAKYNPEIVSYRVKLVKYKSHPDMQEKVKKRKPPKYFVD